MDAFFAAVEQKRNPELKGKPVIIGGRGNPQQRGVVATASYEARRFGIHSAQPLRTAYKLCPQAIFLPVDYREYSRVSEHFKKILEKFSPIIEDVGIDEAFLDISQSILSSEEIAKMIKERIKNDLDLTCSIGIAQNKLLAKIASDLNKPNGTTIIDANNIQTIIWPLEVRKLWGVGPKTEAYLKNVSINTIGTLATMPLGNLQEHFNASYAEYLYDALRENDHSQLVTSWEPKSSSREITFEKDTNNWQTIAKMLAKLSKKISQDLVDTGYLCQTVTLKIKFSDFQILTRTKTMHEATDSELIIRKAAFEALSRVEIKKKVRLLGVRVSNLKAR